MARQTPAKPGRNAMHSEPAAPRRPQQASARRRPKRSAAMPLGISQARLTQWKTPSARPICHREKPRPASSTTQTASVMRRQEEKEKR